VDPEAVVPLYALGESGPQVPDDAFVAPTATLIGAVELGAEASVWFGAVLRGDFDRIVVGAGSCIQDNAVVHAAEGLPTVIGANVTVGHAAMLEGCVIEDGALISMGAIVLQRARVGAGALVAAGSVVREGQEIPPGVVAAGVPAVVKKEVDGSSRHWIETAAAEYRELRRRYLEELEEREEMRW
jgi:carbonic anhydrase/acetyltransferase-like protein (isoleucine patch superfamily)